MTNARRFATAAAAVTAVAAALALGIGVVTPPRGGVLCTSSCIAYPYTDARRSLPATRSGSTRRS